MMKYVLENMKFFKKRERVKEIAKSVQFIPSINKKLHRAQDLFDPEDDNLKNVIIDENKFPNIDNFPIGVRLLHKLGLKTWNDVTSEEILQCANHVNNYPDDHCSENRSKGLIELLRRKGGLLNQVVSDKQLRHWLTNIRFLKPRERKDDYPSSLPWFTEQNTTHFYRPADMADSKYSRLIGCIRPTLQDEDGFLHSALGLQSEPCVNDVISQLLTIKDMYETRLKPELLPLISDIYKYFNSHQHETFSKLKGQKWVWTGNGFEAPEKIYLKVKSSDLNLEPYLYPLPNEFRNMDSFFLKRGCINEQTPQQLINVQMMIREKYDNGGTSIDTAKTDHQIIITILNSLKTKSEKEFDGVLFPIKHDDDTRVILLPAKECNYCKDDDELFGDEQHFVNDDISSDTAEKLGVPSVTDTLLDDAERLEEWGQTEPLTRRIKNLLEAYKDGLSVPKEIIQNADDAGATKVCFMYDERESDGYGRKLLDKNMYECQGPALWAFNNAKFTEDDLKNITKLSGATKQDDLTKIGKFGLGFCSVYNLTEVPSFVTGNQMVIFDPHYKYLGEALKHKKQPGLKVDFRKNRKIVERKRSQFQPFNGVFGCNLSTDQNEICFDGTLFRLPLRTRQQAATSEISNTAYDRGQMSSLMKIFAEAGGNLLLFTQNVSSVEFYYLSKSEGNPVNASLVYSVRRQDLKTVDRPIGTFIEKNKFSVLHDLSTNLVNVKGQRNSSISEVKLTATFEVEIKTGPVLNDFKIKGESSTTTWMVSWATGTGLCAQMAMDTNHKSILPLASVACPLKLINNTFHAIDLGDLPFGYYKTSHVFCYLPLPVETKLPVYINGSFAVTSDRRRLSCKTTDDKDSFESQWNEALMTDAACNAYLLFLERYLEVAEGSDEPFHIKWPVECGKDGNYGKLQESFYRTLISADKKVFRRDDKICNFEKCQFLHASLLEPEFGNDVFQTCVLQLEKDGLVMIKLPNQIRKCMKDSGCNDQLKQKTLKVSDFFRLLVFPHLNDETWIENILDKLLLFAIDRDSEDLNKMLKEHDCIPTLPNRKLRRPVELIDSSSINLSGLFSREDERFLLESPKMYTLPARVEKILKLGMNKNKIPDHMILDRAMSIAPLGKICKECAVNRYRMFMKYIENNLTDVVNNSDLFVKLQQIKFLPVMEKPTDWIWPWGGDGVSDSDIPFITKYTCCNPSHENNHKGLRFDCAANLFSQTVADITCMSKPILYRCDVNERTLQRLGLRTDISVEIAFQNLLILSDSVSQDDTEESVQPNESLRKTTLAIYKYINHYVNEEYNEERKTSLSQIAGTYRDARILYLGGVFIKPCDVVVNSKEDCLPHFYRLDSAPELRPLTGFLTLLNVEKSCSFERVILALRSYTDKNLNENQINVYVKLLRTLVECMKHENNNKDKVKEIFIPDTEGLLCENTSICFDESQVASTGTMKFVHDSISRDIAIALGISSKREKKIKDCSIDFDLIDHSEDFGQHEELTTRIRRILTGYPCDGGILKELIQNADDAQASEVHIIMDLNNYSTDKVFNDEWKSLQGPAILVYNNSAFTEEDIKGIQNLGIGSKYDDPTKTGQYGVGFNSVYHLTDVPSFLTKGGDVKKGELLCVFDPHCKYVPNATPKSPGKMFFDLEILKEDQPDVFECYHSDLLMQNNKGTIFRLPLRQKSHRSKLSDDYIDQKKVKQLFSDLKEEMMDVLLFVNHVKSVKISEICQGRLNTLHSVELRLESNDDALIGFKNKVKDCSKHYKEEGNIEKFPLFETKYKTKVTDSAGGNNDWLIVRRIGFSEQSVIPEKVQKAYSHKELGLLPQGGVALLIKGNTKKIGKLYCGLPIPVDTGLPIYCNGHFALDHEARRNLWNGDEDDLKSAWNRTLLREVIAPAYLSVLIERKTLFPIDKQLISVSDVTNMLSNFYSYFPDVNKVKEIFQDCASEMFRLVYEKEICIFPRTREENAKEARVDFLPLKSKQMTFPCIFDNISGSDFSSSSNFITKSTAVIGQLVTGAISHLRKESGRQEESLQLVRLLKKLGVKLVESPKYIMEGLKKANIEVREMSPDFLIEFLKSFKASTDGCCVLGDIDESIASTTFEQISNVKICLEYCKQSGKFNEEIDGLPLCVTADNVLRCFQQQRPVYRSEYSDIMKGSQAFFLHKELIHLLSTSIHGMKPFLIENFAEIIGYTLPHETFRTHNRPVDWDPKSDTLPNATWLHTVWKFICSAVEGVLEEKKANCKEDIQRVLSPIREWCLIPCMYEETPTNEYSTKSVLFPISLVEHILDLATYKGRIQNTLLQLGLPLLDFSVIKNEVPILRQIVASDKYPCSLLEYLHVHRNDIRQSNLTKDNCSVILDYLSTNLKDILKDDESDERNKSLCKMIKETPIHITVSGNNICLDGTRRVLVLGILASYSIVTKGIEEWALRSDTILLESDYKWKDLYVRLGYTTKDLKPVDIYIDHLLPLYDCFPPDSRIDHLKYIRDTLLAKGLDYDSKQKQLICVLKKLKFLPNKSGNLCTACEFQNPFDELVRLMCNPDQFPIGPFCNWEWRHFLILAGLPMTLSKEMLLHFARQIEYFKHKELNEELRKSSNMLIERILDNSNEFVKDERFLNELSSICFIVPYLVDKQYSAIHPQNESSLICYRESVPQSWTRLTWTTCSLLPSSADPKNGFNNQLKHLSLETRKNMATFLGIQGNPVAEKVILHIQNICDSLKEQFESKTSESTLFLNAESLMTNFYKWLNKNHRENSRELVRRLGSKPLVVLWEKKMFLPCDRFVKQLNENEKEIKPYLMQVPDKYGEYFRLFELLGMEVNTTAGTYARILQNVKVQVGSQALHVNEMQIVKDVMCQLLKHLGRIKNEDHKIVFKNIENLFLLSRGETLENARSLVFSDNQDFEEKIGPDIGMSYVMGFDKLNIRFIGNISDRLKKLPNHMQPNILSDMISKELDENSLTACQGILGNRFKAFCASPEFIEAIARITLHGRINDYQYHSKELSKEEIRTLETGIRCLNIVEVESITMRLVFKGKQVGENSKVCVYQHQSKRGNPEHVLFCSFSEDLIQWVIDNAVTISAALHSCTNNIFADTNSLLVLVLSRVLKPHDIERALDEAGVKRFSIGKKTSSSLFPESGTVVHPNRYCFLSNNFTDFDEKEYVALLISEEVFVDGIFSPAEYIYARIKKVVDGTKSQPFVAYEVEISPGVTEIRLGYDLYKFTRNKDETTKDLVVFVEVSESKDDQRGIDEILVEVKETLRKAWTLPEDERKKIIKRLYKKWHPDKNHGNETKATEAFKFIKIFVLKMERGENIDMSANDQRSYSSNADSFYQQARSNSNFWSHFESWDRDARDNANYRSSSNPFSGCRPKQNRRQTMSEKVPAFAEAMQWLRQAKTDYKAADEFLPNASKGPHYNWICLMSFQCIEKVLKALHLSVDCNNIPDTKDLNQLANGIDSADIRKLVREFVGLVGSFEKIMYPERMSMPKIPADIYTFDTANSAFDVCKRVLEMATDKLV